MKDLKSLFEELKYTLIGGELTGEITELVYDSRKVCPDCIFVAIIGAAFDGHEYVAEAVNNGAKAVVVSKDMAEIPGLENATNGKNVAVIRVSDTRLALALLSAAYFDYPAREVGVIGITGTKGKTTTTYLVKSVLDKAGFPCGLMGTIETIIGDEHIHAVNTTPESYIIQRDLRKMADRGVKYCVMEVSSQGLMLHRTAGIPFKIGLFTNISPDHIGPNEHSDFEDYLHCKSLLFSQCELGIVNIDDPHVEDILKNHTCKVHSFGIEKDADTKGSDIKFIHEEGALATGFRVSGDVDMEVELPLPGYFSVYNGLSAICVCKALGAENDIILKALSEAKIRGRIELVNTNGPFSIIIDYAHNAVSLESILKTLREYEPGRLVSVFGCGGNRDPERRFSMGEVSGGLSDLTIITSDNPRFEEPLDIMENIKTGVLRTGGEFVMVEDRKEALRYAVRNAKPKDVILLAGKGHEDYQEIRGVKHHMDEREICREVLTEEGYIK